LVRADRVVPGRQQAESRRDRDDARQFQVRLPAGDRDTIDGQRPGDDATPGVDGDQQASADPCEQGTDVEDNREGELDGGYWAIINQDLDLRLLRHANPMCGQVDQLGAAGRGQRTAGGGSEITIFAPSFDQHPDQADIEQLGRRRPYLFDGGLAGIFLEVLQGAAEVLVCLC
jgi:hypothetical protein